MGLTRSILPLWITANLVHGLVTPAPPVQPQTNDTNHRHAQVLILGGGVAGIIAARTLIQSGINDVLIIEGRDELGGRMRSHQFAGKTVELGANWIQGTRTGKGSANPIFTLAKKHNVQVVFNDLEDVTTYDDTGLVDYSSILSEAIDNLDALTILAGERVAKRLIDTSARTGYSLSASKPKGKQAAACEYYQFDWEYAQTPEESSWLASAWNNNFTFDADQGGFSEDNLLAIDQRGFKTLIQSEAAEFLQPDQILLNSTVDSISYSGTGVRVTLATGGIIGGDYALCTFSLGVLQNDDVSFNPPLPGYKQEAIQSMTMATYTKIFLQFPEKFWFDTEMALYADPERGRYPVWQSLDHPKFLPGSGIIFVTVTGDFSERIEALPDDQVKAEAMDVLRKMFPNITVPEPNDFFFQRWHSDPFYRGTYSNWPASFTNGHMENLRANLQRLYFAGEATSVKYFGFLHGAYFEGQSMAEVIVRCIRTNGPQCNQPGLQRVAEITNPQPYVFDL